MGDGFVPALATEVNGGRVAYQSVAMQKPFFSHEELRLGDYERSGPPPKGNDTLGALPLSDAYQENLRTTATRAETSSVNATEPAPPATSQQTANFATLQAEVDENVKQQKRMTETMTAMLEQMKAMTTMVKGADNKSQRIVKREDKIGNADAHGSGDSSPVIMTPGSSTSGGEGVTTSETIQNGRGADEWVDAAKEINKTPAVTSASASANAKGKAPAPSPFLPSFLSDTAKDVYRYIHNQVGGTTNGCSVAVVGINLKKDTLTIHRACQELVNSGYACSTGKQDTFVISSFVDDQKVLPD